MRDHRAGMNPDPVDITALVREHQSAVSRPEHRKPAKPIHTRLKGHAGGKAGKILRGQR